jgi:hypothetical protein
LKTSVALELEPAASYARLLHSTEGAL